jgi:hypothetical protein
MCYAAADVIVTSNNFATTFGGNPIKIVYVIVVCRHTCRRAFNVCAIASRCHRIVFELGQHPHQPSQLPHPGGSVRKGRYQTTVGCFHYQTRRRSSNMFKLTKQTSAVYQACLNQRNKHQQSTAAAHSDSFSMVILALRKRYRCFF